jgi:hypothetical protein
MAIAPKLELWKMHAEKSVLFFGGKIHDEKSFEYFFRREKSL